MLLLHAVEGSRLTTGPIARVGMIGIEPTLTAYQAAVHTLYTTRPMVAGDGFEPSNTSLLK